MGWIRCIHCEKLQRDFVVRTFVLIAPVQYVLQQVSCSYGTIPNASKYNETHWNISLGSNGVDWVCSLRKIPPWLRCTNFCINCTSSPRFAPSFKQLRNNPKCTQTLWNTPKHDFRVQWGDQVCSLWKITTWLHGTNFFLIEPVRYVLQQVSCSYEMNPNASKYYETDRNISLGSNGVDWVLRKIPMWCGTNFCINWTSSPRFAPSFMRLRNDPNCTQTLWNTPNHEFTVQCGGLGAFVAKNYNVTSWHELLY
jgi:hypothetical protein